MLAETGYQGLRYDGVAARARAGKMTLYRYWPTKAELVTTAVAARPPEQVPVPDTGTLRGDLLAYFGAVAERVSGQEGAVLAGLFVVMRNDPDLASRLRPLLVPAVLAGTGHLLPGSRTRRHRPWPRRPAHRRGLLPHAVYAQLRPRGTTGRAIRRAPHRRHRAATPGHPPLTLTFTTPARMPRSCSATASASDSASISPSDRAGRRSGRPPAAPDCPSPGCTTTTRANSRCWSASWTTR